MSKSDVVLSCEHLSKSFEEAREKVEVLRNVSFSISAGERVAIVGSSGSGKTTLLHLLGGLDQASSGSVWLQGQNIQVMNEAERACLRNRALGFIYQFHHLLPEFTAHENVAMPLLIRRTPLKEAMDRARYLLQRVGLSHRLEHKMHALSGGERQRVAIARALVGEPACILADEPTGNLDTKTAQVVTDLLVELNQQMGMSLIVVTHDRQIASKMQSHYEMKDGLITRI